MTVIWSKLKKSVVDGVNSAIDKTEELTNVGRTKLEILQLEHKLEEKLTKLGEKVYYLLKEDSQEIPVTGEMLELREQITVIENNLSKKEAELGRIKAEEGIDFDS